MSWLNKLALLFAFFPLISCGFEPVYGTRPHNNGTSAVTGIKISGISSQDARMAQMLHIALEDKLSPGGIDPRPIYRLEANLTYSESAIGTARDGTVSRYNVDLGSTYKLYRIADEKLMATGTLHQVGSYNNLVNEYLSTYISKEDAIKRGVAELAEVYRQRMAAYLGENNGNPPVREPETPDTANIKDMLFN